MSYNPFSLEGKKILVTGASSGIGRATAVECSRMGASVFATGRDRARLEETISSLDGEGHGSAVADLTVDDQMKALVDALSSWGALDGVVLAAGIANVRPVKMTGSAQMASIFEVNVFSQAELLKTLLGAKALAEGASVVAISSVSSGGEISLGHAAYGSSKAALQTFMKYAALELGPKVRVNTICPGMVDTPLIHKGTFTPEQLEADSLHYPLKRYGRPEDVALGAVYLLSDAASWITGHSLVIDGGISLI